MELSGQIGPQFFFYQLVASLDGATHRFRAIV